MNSALSFANLAKSFGSRAVLRGVDLDVPVGSVVGLLGSNGSGKTTLLKCAVGLLRPQSGECKLLGEPSWNLSPAAKTRLGYVPQVISLFPWMKVADLIAYCRSFYPTWNDALVDQLRQQWEIETSDRVGVLSVGQMQKVAILLALAHEPELLVLDEPAASLDPAARRQFLQLIIDLPDPMKRTVLFSTHITSDLERIADRVAILRKGQIVYNGMLDDLKDQMHLNLEDAYLEMNHA
jgi:ABC-2 type transport system ATP-binding protein